MSLRVLLADESASIRKVFQMGLQDYGAEVKSVHNGLDVVEVAQNYEPHIIFADILLQKKNGYEVAQEIGSHDSLRLTPVVLMWSSFMELDQGKYKSCGAKAELEKPFDIDKMRGLIKDLVESTKSQHLSDFLTFPKSISAEFAEEENTKRHGGEAPSSVQAPSPPPFDTASFELNESDEEGPALSLEDDTPVPVELEATSEFNNQAGEPEEFDMYEVPPPPRSESMDQTFSQNLGDQWEAKPLNQNMKKDPQVSQTQGDDLDQFESMDLGDEKKMNLDDFLYRPKTQSEFKDSKSHSHSTTRTGEIHNVNVPNYDNRTNSVTPKVMSTEEVEAVIRQEVRIALTKIVKEQLPIILEKVVREELENIMQQEMAIKGAGQNP